MQTKHCNQAVAILVLLVASGHVHASDLVWTNLAGGNWNVAANWTPNQVPGAVDTAWITNSGTYTVTVSANASVAGLTLGGDSGTQTLSLTAGTFTLNGDGTGNTHSALRLSGGTFAGAGTLALDGPLNWTGGTISGGVQCNGGSVSGSGVRKYLTGGRLINTGVLTFSHGMAPYPFYTGSGSVISNLAGATCDMVTDAGLLFTGTGARGTIYNAGLWRKSAGTGVSTLDDTFHNTGTVEANSGTLQLANGGGNSGTNGAIGSAKLDFGGGTHTLDANARLVGSGTISTSSGTNNFSGTCALTVTNLVSGGTLNFNNATPVAVGALTVTGGTLGGSGWVEASGALNWTGGRIAGGVQCNGGSIAGSNAKHLTGGRLINTGVLTFSHSGTSLFYTGSGSVISNLAGATFDMVTDTGTSFSGTGTRGTIYNAGLWRKTAGAGVSALGDNFNNTGTVEANSGTLDYTRPFTQTDGATWLLSGRLQVDQGFMLNGGVLAGTNTVIGSVTNRATLSPGASPGVLTITGHYTEGTNAHLQIELGGPAPGSGHDQLSVGGTATLVGTLDLSYWNGFEPVPGNVFTALVCNARSGAFSAIQAPTNTMGVLYNPKNVLVEPGNASPMVQLTVDSDWLACHTFRLRASATDADGTVTNLTMLVGTDVLGSYTNGANRMITLSYDFPGETTFTAQATDNKGAMGAANVLGTVGTLPSLVLDPIGFQTNRAFKLCFCGEAGTNYALQFGTNLPSTNWITLGTMENTNGIWRYLDTSATNSAHRYYRARQLP